MGVCAKGCVDYQQQVHFSTFHMFKTFCLISDKQKQKHRLVIQLLTGSHSQVLLQFVRQRQELCEDLVTVKSVNCFSV